MKTFNQPKEVRMPFHENLVCAGLTLIVVGLITIGVLLAGRALDLGLLMQ